MVGLSTCAIAQAAVAGPEARAAGPFVACAVAALGACNGSFAELISRRLPEARSILWPPSACDACGRGLRPWHNLPVVSYLCLRGRCGFCRARIPARTLWVEAIMAAVGWMLFQRLGLCPRLCLWMPLSAVAMAVALCDLDYFWVPDAMVVAGLACALPMAWLDDGPGPWVALGGVLPALAMWGVGAAFTRLRGLEGLGMGDVKWAGVMGLAVGGFAAWGMIFWASVQGALWALGQRALGRRRRAAAAAGAARSAPLPPAIADDADWQPPEGAIPFAPFLSLAALEVVWAPDFFAVGTGMLKLLQGA